ncbi:hypothetical protein ScPMuIL_018523 [Solemya velum]
MRPFNTSFSTSELETLGTVYGSISSFFTGIPYCFPEMLMWITSLAFFNLMVLFVSAEQERCCPFNVCKYEEYSNLNKLFPGLFVDEKNFWKYKNPNRNQFIFKISSFRVLQPDTKNSKFKRSSGVCCEVEQQFIVPETVENAERTYNVTHYDHSYQILVQGVCSSESSSFCQTCIQEFSYQWVLVDVEAVEYEPPVVFVPVSYPSNCRCANPGQRRDFCTLGGADNNNFVVISIALFCVFWSCICFVTCHR